MVKKKNKDFIVLTNISCKSYLHQKTLTILLDN